MPLFPIYCNDASFLGVLVAGLTVSLFASGVTLISTDLAGASTGFDSTGFDSADFDLAAFDLDRVDFDLSGLDRACFESSVLDSCTPDSVDFDSPAFGTGFLDLWSGAGLTGLDCETLSCAFAGWALSLAAASFALLATLSSDATVDWPDLSACLSLGRRFPGLFCRLPERFPCDLCGLDCVGSPLSVLLPERWSLAGSLTACWFLIRFPRRYKMFLRDFGFLHSCLRERFSALEDILLNTDKRFHRFCN